MPYQKRETAYLTYFCATCNLCKEILPDRDIIEGNNNCDPEIIEMRILTNLCTDNNKGADIRKKDEDIVRDISET